MLCSGRRCCNGKPAWDAMYVVWAGVCSGLPENGQVWRSIEEMPWDWPGLCVYYLSNCPSYVLVKSCQSVCCARRLSAVYVVLLCMDCFEHALIVDGQCQCQCLRLDEDRRQRRSGISFWTWKYRGWQMFDKCQINSSEPPVMNDDTEKVIVVCLVVCLERRAHTGRFKGHF